MEGAAAGVEMWGSGESMGINPDSGLLHAMRGGGEPRFNLREAIEGCLSVPVDAPSSYFDGQAIELVV
jgi:hypothetical protein